MTVRLRLQRFGKPHAPSYRVVAIDHRKRRNGEPIEVLGQYNPLTEKISVNLNKERVDYWLKQGAQPSDTVASLIKAAEKAEKAAPAAGE